MTTVKIQHPGIKGEYIVINESDFDEKQHKLFAEAGKQSGAKARTSAKSSAKAQPST